MNKHYNKADIKEINKTRSPRQCLTHPVPDVNRQRLTLGAKGFLTVVDMRTYLGGVSYGKAKQIYNCIKDELEENGKKVSPLGLPTLAVNQYLNITDKQIRDYAAMGL